MPAGEACYYHAITARGGFVCNHAHVCQFKEWGDFKSASGTALLNVMAGISGASAINSYLVKIEPGLYEIGGELFSTKPYVDVEGSGEGITEIRGSGSDLDCAVQVVNNSELRYLTVENVGGRQTEVAIQMAGTEARLLHVTARTSGGFSGNRGIEVNFGTSAVLSNVSSTAFGSGVVNRGILVQNPNVTVRMTNVKAEGSGASSTNRGIDFTGGIAEMQNVEATASEGSTAEAFSFQGSQGPLLYALTGIAQGASVNRGILVSNSDVNIHQSRFSADTDLIADSGGTARVDGSSLFGGGITVHTGSTVFIGGSRISGSVGGGGSFTCAGVYDQNFTFFSNSCP